MKECKMLEEQEGLLLADYVSSAVNLITAKLLRELKDVETRTRLNVETECEDFKNALIEIIAEVTE